MGELVRVDSSMIQAVGYDADARVLEVLFNSGKTYLYEGVPPEIHQGLLDAASKGQYMNAHIIDVYPDHQRSRRRR
jgi:KTSC domain-containing protein